jgi:hypothetical protein
MRSIPIGLLVAGRNGTVSSICRSALARALASALASQWLRR